MDKEQIIRAWKDEEYRSALGEADSSLLPEHPAGVIEIPDERMDEVAGGFTLSTCGFVLSIYMGGTCSNLSTGCCGPIQKFPV
jgi:mersacidin/lichenicidin family type 2 lantibiotic